MAKIKRLQPRLVKGFRDVLGQSVADRERMIARIRSVYDLYGFMPLETPLIEYLDVLGKHLPDTDTPEEGVYSFRNPDDEEWIALRYDLTAPLSRMFAEHRRDLPTPFRRYQIGTVCRYEKPGPGRFRQFTQCDLDTVGAAKMSADVEILCALCDAFEAIGLPRGGYRMKVNNRKIVNGLLEKAGLPLEGGRHLVVNEKPVEVAVIVMRTLDKLDRLGRQGVELLLGEGRKDESGAFIKGAGLSADERRPILDYLDLSLETSGRSEVLQALEEQVGSTKAGGEGVMELREIDRLLSAAGFDEERVAFDPTIIRGLGYYTGPVFEAELTLETVDEDGRPVRFGSVGGGGRYDTLVQRFTGEKVPATGASIGVDRLIEALKLVETGDEEAPLPPVLVTTMDKSLTEEYQRMTFELRAHGIRAEMFHGGGNFKKQLKYADLRGCPAAVIMGSNEFENGRVSIKDLRMGAELSNEIEDHETWRKDQPAQVEVGRNEMVQAILDIFARWKR